MLTPYPESPRRAEGSEAYRVDCCHNGGEPVPAANLDDDDAGGGFVFGIGVLVATLETALLLALL